MLSEKLLHSLDGSAWVSGSEKNNLIRYVTMDFEPTTKGIFRFKPTRQDIESKLASFEMVDFVVRHGGILLN